MSTTPEQLNAALAGRYRIERELGAGGMATVWLAHDLKHDRKVAIKVLHPHLAALVGADRFVKEIKTTANLQHPHILPLFDSGEADGLLFYVMPVVDGESLRQRILREKQLPVAEAVRITSEVASALDYAHRQGVIHRDIKPENILLHDGQALVADFGIALASNTGDTRLTETGLSIGTPSYMSPEQALGERNLDARTDIYAVGAMLYEMLTGTPPFTGPSAQAVVAKVISQKPVPPSRVRNEVPAQVEDAVLTSLQKEPADRFPTAAALQAALVHGPAPLGPIKPSNRTSVIAVTGGLLVTAMIAFTLWNRPSSAPAFQSVRVHTVATTADLEREPAISPDGSLVAYALMTPDGYRIFWRQTDGGGSAHLISQAPDGNQRRPRWSPDGSKILFVANGIVYVVPWSGGSPRREIVSPGNWITSASWSGDGTQFVFADNSGIWVQPVGGGDQRNVVQGPFVHSAAWSPDGQRLAYVSGRPLTLNNTSNSSVWIVGASGGPPHRISDSTHLNVSPQWAPDGKSVLYLSDADGTTDLRQQAVRSDGSPAGQRQRVATALQAFTFTMSTSGDKIAYDVVTNPSRISMATMANGATVQTRDGRQVTNQNEHVEALALSHDGKWLAYDAKRSGNTDIYKLPQDGGDAMPLTHDPADHWGPNWSPGDSEIAYYSSRSGTRHIYVMNADGTRDAQVTTGPADDYMPRWSPDGRQLAFMRQSAKGNEAYMVRRNPNGQWSAPSRISPDSVNDVQPATTWLDSNHLAFSSRGAVSVIALDTRRVTVFTDSTVLGGPASDLNWEPSSATLYVAVWHGMIESTRQRRWIMAVPAAGVRKPWRALEDDPEHPFAWVSFATDGRRIVFTVGIGWDSDVKVMDLKR